MAKAWNGIGNTNNAFSGSSDQFLGTGGATINPDSTENRRQFKLNFSVTLGKGRVLVSANARNQANTGFIRKNAANTSVSWSITASTTGWFEDNVNTASFVAGDFVNLLQRQNLGTGSFTVEQYAYEIDSGTGNYPRTWYQATSDALTPSFLASTTYVWGLCGNFRVLDTSAGTRQQLRCRVTGTFSRLQIYVSANTATGSTTMRFRKNGANGNQVVTVPSSTTGHFEDTTNTDTVADGDLVNINLVTAASGSISATMAGVCFEATENAYEILAQSSGGRTRTSSTATEFAMVAGSGAQAATESQKEIKVPVPFDASRLRVYVDSAPTNSTTFTLRKNGADTALAISTITTTTGWYEDASDVVGYAAGDLICLKISAASSSTVVWYTTAIKCAIVDGSGVGGGGGGGGNRRRSFVVG